MALKHVQKDEPSDDDLMRAIAGRDGDAFARVVERSVSKLHRIGYRMLGNASDAEDVTQEALLRLWDTAGRWRRGGPGILPWLNRVVTNLCLDRLRRRKFVSDEDAPERTDDTPGADVQMDDARLRGVVLEAMAALPDRQRAAIVLTYYEELSNQAAADAMEMNVKAFESLLLRARQALKSRFAEQDLDAVALWGDG